MNTDPFSQRRTQRKSIAEVIAIDLHETEQAALVALLEVAKLSASVIEGTRAAGVHPTMSLSVLKDLHSAQGHHLKGLDCTAAAHRQATIVGRALRVSASGPTEKPPPSSVPGFTEAAAVQEPTTAVATAAE